MMAVFTAAAMSMRRKRITDALRTAGATGPETARKLSETGLETPDFFEEYTQQLADAGFIHRTKDGRFYVNPDQDL